MISLEAPKQIHRMADFLTARAEPKIVNYHNVTPGHYWAPWEPLLVPELVEGRHQMGRLGAGTVFGISDSTFNNDELLAAGYRRAEVCPILADYDDLLLYWAQTVSDPLLAQDIGGRFDHVLVDEYQDTNRLQSSILLALKPAGEGLTVVGDDAQSIYSFRAATVRNILDFPGQFTPPARIVTLDRNYRSTQTILAAANGVIELASERFTKNLWTERTSSAKPQLVSVRDEADQA